MPVYGIKCTVLFCAEVYCLVSQHVSLIVNKHLWHHSHASHASNEGRMSSTAQACDNLLAVFDGHTWVM